MARAYALIGEKKGVSANAIVDHEIEYGTRINQYTHQPEPDLDKNGVQKVARVEISLANGKHIVCLDDQEIKDALDLIGSLAGSDPAPAAQKPADKK